VQALTGRSVCIEFVKEHLTFTGDDSPMANLMLSVMWLQNSEGVFNRASRNCGAMSFVQGGYA
jgi:hypothetical protein